MKQNDINTIMKRGEDGMGRMISETARTGSGALTIALVLAFALLFIAGGLIIPGETQATGWFTGNVCAGCHGYPPVDNAAGRDATTGRFPGSHDTHMSYGLTCAKCHANPEWTTVNHSNGNIQMLAPLGQPVGSGGWGTYSKGTSFAQSNSPSFGTCNNTYCHGGTMTGNGGVNINPKWVSSNGAMTCASQPNGACHGGWATNHPLTGSHTKHSGNGANELAFACTTCHYGWTESTHLNGNVSWRFDPTNPILTSIASSYRGANWGSTGAVAPSATYGVCSVYCHSSVQTNGATAWYTYVNASWGSSGSGACGTCHGIPPTSGSHSKHIPLYSSIITGCLDCHNSAGSGSPLHVNMVIENLYSQGGSYSQANKAPGKGYGQCSSTACHSTFYGMNAANKPTWGSSPTGACGTCHGANSTTPPFSTPHADHVGSYKMACATCHNGVVAVTADATTWASIKNPYDHLDTVNNPDITFNSTKIPNGGSVWATYNATGKSCNVYCHSNGTSVQRTAVIVPWSSISYSNTVSCDSCHGGGSTPGQPWYTNGFPKRNSHTAHTTVCDTCHAATVWTSVGNGSSKIVGWNTHVNGVYNLAPKSGYSFQYTFSTLGGTCINGSCHGTAQWGVSVMDCTTCHSSQLTKSKGTIGTIRNVTGSGGDFSQAYRHILGTTTIFKWDCIVCHMEGQATGANAGKTDVTYHNDSSGFVDVRNVDNPSTGWAINNKNWSTTDYSKLDTFCLSCHDADGASKIQVGPTNNGMNWMTNGRALTPFNTFDTAGNYVRGSTYWITTARQRVLDVQSLFYAGTGNTPGLYGGTTPGAGWGANYNGNPSQHAVIGRRYEATNVRWGTASGIAWADYTAKKTGVTLKTARETSLLSCADCHVLDTGGGAHGGNNYYNLWGTSSAAGAVNVKSICIRCHTNTVYDNAGSPGVSRYNHTYSRAVTGWGLPSGGGTMPGCMTCHASWTSGGTESGTGGIHGSWSSTATTGGSPSNKAYRFFPGVWRRSSAFTNDDGWTTTNQTGACYFYANGAAAGFSSCSSHAGASGGTYTPAYGRPVKY